MKQAITYQQKEDFKAIIFEEIAAAISQTSQQDWRQLILRLSKAKSIAQQLENTDYEN